MQNELQQESLEQTGEVGGLIGYYGLSEWWLGELSPQEQASIIARCSPSYQRVLAKGGFEPDTGSGFGTLRHSSGMISHYGTSACVLTRVASGLCGSADYALITKVIKKLVADIVSGHFDLIDLHHALGWLVQRFYGEQAFDQLATQRAIWACVKHIEIAPQVRQLLDAPTNLRPSDKPALMLEAARRRTSLKDLCIEKNIRYLPTFERFVSRQHAGYATLARIYDRQKNFSAVVALYKQALGQGWGDLALKERMLKCGIYAMAEPPPDRVVPQLPELRWDESLLEKTSTSIEPKQEPPPCPIPTYQLVWAERWKPEKMTPEQLSFYRKLKKSIGDKSFLPVHNQYSYLQYYLWEDFRNFDKPTLESLHDQLLTLREAYGEWGNWRWTPNVWIEDCLIALEDYDRFFDATKPASIFSTRTHQANWRCSVRYHLGRPASGIDLLQMYAVRVTATTKQHPAAFEGFVEAVFAEEANAHGPWFEHILSGSSRTVYTHGLFDLLHFQFRSKIPVYCFYHCSDPVKERIKAAFRLAENRLRQHLGKKNVGERWEDEAKMYHAIKAAFPTLQVIHQGQPEWLGQFRFDVWLPDLQIAIEYHGIQHFEAMRHYGGEDGLEATKKRDALKREACRIMNVRLFEVSSLSELPNLLHEIAQVAQGRGCAPHASNAAEGTSHSAAR